MTAKAVIACLAGCVSMLAVAGCSAQPGPQQQSSAPSSAARSDANAAASGARIAVSHTYELRLPNADVEAAQKKDLAECQKLGCTILSTTLSRLGEGAMHASSSVRMTPEAYATFAAIISSPPVVVRHHSQRAEDESTPLLDAEKRLEIKTALRDRLMAMLRDQPAATTADAVNIAKELAQVQEDLETLAAQQAHLLSITSTVRVDITYGGESARLAGFDVGSISRAIDGFGQTLVRSTAGLISFVAIAAPWLPLAAFLWWLVRRLLRRRKAAMTPA